MTALPEPPRPPATPLTLAEKVYRTPELRQYIFDFIAPKRLPSFMPVCREALSDMARQIYAKVEYKNADSFNRDIARHAVYADAVRELSIGRWPSLRPHPEPRNFPPFTVGPEGYDPAHLEYLLPLLQEQFPNLAKVKFAGERRGFHITYWTVTLSPPGSDARGQVELKESIQVDSVHMPSEVNIAELHRTPPEGFDLIASLTTYDDRSRREALSVGGIHRLSKYFRETLRDRLQNLGVGSQQITLMDLARWVDDLVSDSSNAKTHGAPDQRVQLKSIDGTSVLPWTIGEFSTFARMAGPKLRHLESFFLYPSNTGTGGGRGASRSASDDERIINRPKMTIPDLEILMKDIPAYLPSLKRLTIGIGPGSVDYEEWCSSRLPVGFPPGQLDRLTLVMPDDHTPWNLARYLAPLLSDSPHLSIKWRRGCRAGGKYGSHLLRYIASAPAQRQAKLRVTDFETLNISNMCDIDKLRYDEDDYPLPFTAEEKKGNCRSYGRCEDCKLQDAGRYT